MLKQYLDDDGYQNIKIGILLKQLWEKTGLTQEELAAKLNTKKSAISRIENHYEDIRLSTLEKYASALGKKSRLKFLKNNPCFEFFQ